MRRPSRASALRSQLKSGFLWLLAAAENHSPQERLFQRSLALLLPQEGCAVGIALDRAGAFHSRRAGVRPTRVASRPAEAWVSEPPFRPRRAATWKKGQGEMRMRRQLRAQRQARSGGDRFLASVFPPLTSFPAPAAGPHAPLGHDLVAASKPDTFLTLFNF